MDDFLRLIVKKRRVDLVDFEPLRKARKYTICWAYRHLWGNLGNLPRPYTLQMYRLVIFILKTVRLHDASIFGSEFTEYSPIVRSLLLTEGSLSMSDACLGIDDHYYNLTTGQAVSWYVLCDESSFLSSFTDLYLIQVIPHCLIPYGMDPQFRRKISDELLLYDGTSTDSMFSLQSVSHIISNPPLIIRSILDKALSQETIDKLYFEGMRENPDILSILLRFAAPSEALQQGIERMTGLFPRRATPEGKLNSLV